MRLLIVSFRYSRSSSLTCRPPCSSPILALRRCLRACRTRYALLHRGSTFGVHRLSLYGEVRFRFRVSFGLPPHDDPQQGLQRGGGHADGARSGECADGVRDGPVLGRVGRILAKPCGAAHPHVHHHRVTVSGDGTGKRVRLGAAKAVEALPDASVGSVHVGAQTLRRDALRVLGRLRLIVRPRHTGRERGHNGRGDFHAPLGAQDAERLREVSGLGVPLLRGGVVEEGSRCEVADEGFDGVGADGFVTVGASGAHAYIVPCHAGHVNGWGRNIIIFFPSDNVQRGRLLSGSPRPVP